jgi:hypothetical protein
MQRLAELGRRLSFLFRRKRFERDLAREMALHLELQAEDNLANGMAVDEARHAATRQFGNPTLLHESSRDAWGWAWLDRLGQGRIHLVVHEVHELVDGDEHAFLPCVTWWVVTKPASKGRLPAVHLQRVQVPPRQVPDGLMARRFGDRI